MGEFEILQNFTLNMFFIQPDANIFKSPTFEIICTQNSLKACNKVCKILKFDVNQNSELALQY